MVKRTGKKEVVKLFHDFDAFEQFLDDIEASENGSGVKEPSAPKKIFLGPGGGVIDFLHPREQHPVSTGFMRAASIELQDYIKAKELHGRDFLQFLPLVALPGDILARETCPASPVEALAQPPPNDYHQDESALSLKPGGHVKLTPKGEYISEQYGFVSLESNRLSVLSPLKISRDQLRVDWLIPPDHPQDVDVDRQMLDFWLATVGVKTELESALPDLMRAVNEGTLAAGHYLIASGQPPVHGEDGKIEWYVDIHQSIGRELPDGRIDFREQNYVVNVDAGQTVARLKPATRGIPGRDIKGRVQPANAGKPGQLFAGDHIRQERVGSEILYIAEMDGALHHINDRLFVTNVLVLPSGVNYQTGNIDFAGDVIIQGAIASGFSVRAGGDVIVTDSVENGSVIESQGSVNVARSISGKRTFVKAAVNVRAQYVVEATIKAGHDILLANYSMHAKLRAIGIIQVKKGVGEYGGSIMGGETWATQGIDIFTAGTVAWIKTELIAGILPEQTEKLDKLQASIEGKNIHINQILDYFGLVNIDLNKIRSKIEHAEGMVQKSMALRAKYLAKAGKALQNLLTEKAELVAEIGPAPENAEIKIRESVYPNVIVCIANKRRKLESEMGSITFQLQQDKLVTR